MANRVADADIVLEQHGEAEPGLEEPMTKLGRGILHVAVAKLALQKRVVGSCASFGARFEHELDALWTSCVGKRADGRMPGISGGDRQRAPPGQPRLPRAQRYLRAGFSDVSDAAFEAQSQRIRIVA